MGHVPDGSVADGVRTRSLRREGRGRLEAGRGEFLRRGAVIDRQAGRQREALRPARENEARHVLYGQECRRRRITVEWIEEGGGGVLKKKTENNKGGWQAGLGSVNEIVRLFPWLTHRATRAARARTCFFSLDSHPHARPHLAASG